MDGTETGWGRPAEPAPRWRALLDRARGTRTDEQPQAPESDGEQDNGTERARSGDPAEPAPATIRPADPRAAAAHPLPTRPVNPLDRRSRNPLDPRPPESRPTSLEPRAAGDARQLDVQRQIDAQRAGEAQRHGEGQGHGEGQRHAEGQRPADTQRPVNPLDRRPVNPLDRRPGGREPQRPVNPLDPRRHSRSGDAFQGRGDAADAPHSFFNPAVRSAPPPITRVTQQDTGYPPARAAASVGSAAVLPPVAPAAPTSPAARIEWRQVSRQEADVERAVAVLRRKLGRPRVLAFANPKGGVHKTTATVLAAATIGSVRGRGVLAWDDNELRGTLGLRAGSARHARTIRHLVTDLMQIENLHGEALTDRLDDYLRHASDGSYDVLAGEENPRFAQRLDQHTVRRVVDLLRRTHEVICVDTGNNVESVNWQTVMKAADQLIITTVPREDAAFTADWMLDLLDEIGMDDMVASAVTLLSCPTAGPLPLLDDLQKHFATRTRAVVVVPYDPALEVGSSIEYSALQQPTREAWMRAAAVMIEPFAE